MMNQRGRLFVLLLISLVLFFGLSCARAQEKNGKQHHLPLVSHRALPHLNLRNDQTKLSTLYSILSSLENFPVPPFDSPLGGSIWPTGGYFAQIWLGTPLQPQLVQVDTGSSDLLVAEVGCAGCPQGDQYSPESSKTSQQATCADPNFRCLFCANGTSNNCYYNNTYYTCDYSDPTAACSLLGPTYYDAFSMGGGTLVPKVGFGGITLHAGAFDNEWTNMPGVMGMAYPSLSGVWLNNTVFDSLVSAGEVNNIFGLCLGPSGGHLTIGGVNQSLIASEIYYTPLVTEMWYVIEMSDFGINGVSLGLDPVIYNTISNGTIIDSGTYNLVVTGEAFDVMAAELIQMCDTYPLVGVCNVPSNETLFSGSCYPMQDSDIQAFPNVSIWLKDIDQPFNLRGEDYLLLEESPNVYCLGIQSSGIGGFTILGNVFQQPFYIIFDRENSQLGFAEASSLCDTGGLA